MLFLSLAAAALYGASDFLGGLLSRRAPYAIVGLIGQAAAAVGAVAAALTLHSPLPGDATILWGMGAGVGGGVGTMALYRGLSQGRMNVAGPLSAVGAAGFPVLIDMVSGQHLTTATILGIGLAIPGIWMVSSGSGTRNTGGAGEGLLAGLGFAGLFICLNRAGDAAGLWPVAMSQLTSLTVLGTAAIRNLISTRAAIRTAVSVWSLWMAIWPGVLGVSATTMYFLATREGTLTVTAVITSLYPAFTIGLAALILRERTNPLHGVGLFLCAISVGAFVIG
jgi:uncharacterized membrane protein